MAATKKTKAKDVLDTVEEQIVNAEIVETVLAKEEAHGVSEKEAETLAADSGKEAAVKTAKAGKRSAKGLAEAEAKVEKTEHQLRRAEEEAEKSDAPKQPVKPTRSRLERRGKGYRKSAELIEKGKVYSLKDALELAAKTSSVKFDSSVELHINLGVDPRQADQNIRANLVLPQGTGQT
jgi:hypothetical protein